MLDNVKENYDNCHLMNARNEALCARAAAGEAAP